MATTPNMALIESLPLVTAGPTWAQNIEDNFLLIDQHDHTSGKGVPVPTAAIQIDDDLSLGNFSLTDIKTLVFQSQSSPLTGDDFLSVVSGDLYFNDGNGNQVRITAGGIVNVAGVGGITGMGGTTAAVTYSNLIKTFTFTQDANKAANIDAGNITVHEPGVTSANGVKIKSPTSLGASYDLTLFTALPVSSKFVDIDSAGNLTATRQLDNTTLETSSGTIRIKDNTPLTGSITIAGVLTDTSTSSDEAIIAYGNPTTGLASQAQFTARGKKGGFGAGIRGVSELTNSTTVQEMGRAYWTKSNAWTATGATQSANWRLENINAASSQVMVEVTNFGELRVGASVNSGWTPDATSLVHFHQTIPSTPNILRMSATTATNGMYLSAKDDIITPGTLGSDIILNNRDTGYISLRTGGTTAFVVTPGARIRANMASTAASFFVGIDGSGNFVLDTSSLRYKKNVLPMEKEINTGDIDALRPVTYEPIEGGDRCVGLIAEEVFSVFPIVVPMKEIEGKKVPDGVNYTRLTAILVAEVQKLRARVSALEAPRG